MDAERLYSELARREIMLSMDGPQLIATDP
jgi:hypothetical protein